MKKHIVAAILCLLSLTCFPQTDLVSYDFNYCSTSPSYVFPGFAATQVTTTAPLAVGCSLGCATGCSTNSDCLANTSFITKSWTGVSTNFAQYCQFTISAAPSVSFYLNQFFFSYRRSSTGPLNFSVYVNGTMKAFNALSGTSCNSFGVGLNQLYTGSAVFRIYFWNGALDGTIRLDNFRITHSFTTLPIELVYFKGTPNHNRVDLEWMTASEANNSHFEIQKSFDGLEFANIATISSVGNSQQTVVYHHSDFGLSNTAAVYYRLKQVDYDGQFSYSPVVAVSNKLNGIVNQGGTIFLRESTNYSRANIYDISGKFVHNLIFGGVRLNSGVYIVELNLQGFSSLQTIYIGQE